MGKSCNFFEHMVEKNHIESIHFQQKLKIHGHLSHDYAPEEKVRWFIYQIHDIPCDKIIIGSTQDPKLRWANYKSSCNRKVSNKTGLSKHFMEGCPNDDGKRKQNLSVTLIDFYDTTTKNLVRAKHEAGPQCRCEECLNLKDLEDKWIMKVGSFYGKSGLNKRDEVKAKTRNQRSSNKTTG